MDHSERLKIRFRILRIIRELRTEKSDLYDRKYFDLGRDYYTLEKFFISVLDEFDLTGKITTNFQKKISL